MATVDLAPTSFFSSTWSGTGLTLANISTSNDVRAVGGLVGDEFVVELDNVPGDFGSLNTVTLNIEARFAGSGRTKQFNLELLDSNGNTLNLAVTGDLSSTDTVLSSTAFTRSDAASVIDGYRFRVVLTEGGGMPGTATHEIDRVWVTLDYNAAAQNFTLTAEQTSFSLTGQAADFPVSRAIIADQQSYALAGQAANLLKGSRVVADQQSYSLSGQAAAFLVDRAIVGDQQSYTLAGQAASLLKSNRLVAEQGSFTLAGQDAGLAKTYVMPADQQSYSLSGQAANLLKDSRVVADQQSYSLSGQAANLVKQWVVTADQQSYSLSGQAADLLVGRRLVADQGSFALAGQDASLLKDSRVVADQQSYALAGQDANLAKSYVLTADQQSYSLSGQAADLLVGRRLVADQQSYSLSGQSANLLKGTRLVADQQSYALTGQAATLTYTPLGNPVMTADPGSFALTGQAASLLKDSRLVADQQSYTLAGQAANLNVDYIMPAVQQSYTLNGQPANFLLGRRMVADQGSFTLAGQAANLVYTPPAKLTADPGVFTLAGQNANLYKSGTASYTLVAEPRLFQTLWSLSFFYQVGGPLIPSNETLAPDAILVQSNLGGTVSLIDDPVDVSDGQCLFAVSDNTESVCVVSFPTPSGLLNSGPGLQQFRARVRLTINGSPIPWSMYLREDGVRRNGGAPLAGGTVTGEQIIEATWDAAFLTNIDGAGVECEIVLGRQAGNPSVRTAGEVCAVEWNNDFALEGDPPLTADRGTFSVQGQPATFRKANRLVAEQGDFLTVGSPVNILRQYTMTQTVIDEGFFTYAGAEIELHYNRIIRADQGDFTLTGQPVDFKYTSNLFADPGNFALAGQDANLVLTRRLEAQQGSFNLLGQQAGLYTGANVSMTADPGSFSIAGQSADFKVSVIPDALAFAFDGQDAILLKSSKLVAEQGSFAWTGYAANIGLAFGMEAEEGSFALAGESVVFRVDKDFTLDEGAFTLTGGNATLYWSGPVHTGPDDQDIQIVVVS